MIVGAGKPKVCELRVSRGDLRPLEQQYTEALSGLQQALQVCTHAVMCVCERDLLIMSPAHYGVCAD